LPSVMVIHLKTVESAGNASKLDPYF
jgi:hypothetical protein